MYSNEYGYPYGLFNQKCFIDYERYLQSSFNVQQHHIEQNKNILDMRKAIKDFCDASRKLSPDYRDQAMRECIQELMLQAIKDGYISPRE